MYCVKVKVEDVYLLSATNVTSALFAILVSLKIKDTRLVNTFLKDCLVRLKTKHTRLVNNSLKDWLVSLKTKNCIPVSG